VADRTVRAAADRQVGWPSARLDLVHPVLADAVWVDRSWPRVGVSRGQLRLPADPEPPVRGLRDAVPAGRPNRAGAGGGGARGGLGAGGRVRGRLVNGSGGGPPAVVAARHLPARAVRGGDPGRGRESEGRMNRVCVFCGSSLGARSEYSHAAAETGALLAGRGLALVYGGGHVGLMGVVADAALRAGGSGVGVITQALVDREGPRSGLT